MATKKQMNETINRVDIIEDSMLKMEDHLGLLKEMITMQNKHIDSMMQLIIKNENIKKNSIIQEDIIKIEKENVSSLNDEVSLNKKKVLGGYARRII
jgi:hypothetical protein